MDMIQEYLNKLKLQPKKHISPGVKRAVVQHEQIGSDPELRAKGRNETEESGAAVERYRKSVADVHPGMVETEANVHHDLVGKGRRQEGSAAKSEAKRGRFDYMQYIHGFIGFVLVLMVLIHVPFPDPLEWVPYALAATLAFITLTPNMSMSIARILAISTAGLMFFFFALFFLLVPRLEADWYTTQFGWSAVCRILAAFLMIPILSDYSCRLKKDCMEAREARRTTAFFSVPNHIRPSR